MTITTLRTGLAARVATISGLLAYDTIPATAQAPCVLVQLMGADYDLAMADGGMVARFDLDAVPDHEVFSGNRTG